MSYDHLGSVRLVTDQSGKVVSRHDYLPFGEEIPTGTNGRTAQFGASDNVSLRFTGKERDGESGLDYFGARYYGSALGRFTSPDEFQGGIVDPFTGQDVETHRALPYADITDPQTLNKYAYVRNNPLRYTDPTGHCIEDLCIGEAAAATYVTTQVIQYLQTPQGQQGLQAIGQGIQAAVNGIYDLITTRDPSKPSTLQPGPHAGDSIPARSPDRNFTPGERDQINDIGKTTGCHTCGTTNPGTKSGNFVPDHQPPTGVNTDGKEQQLYPHCLGCSRQQGGEVRGQQQQQQRPQPPPVRKKPDGTDQ